jgi:protein O-GlcNAc transferase
MSNSTQETFQSLMSFAQQSHQKGDLEMAVNLYRESLKVIRDHPDALHFMGIALSSMGKDDKAVECLLKAVRSAPHNPVFLVNLAEVYLKLRKYPDAYEVLNKAVAMKPDFAEAFNKLGNALRGIGNSDAAVRMYAKTLELNPRHFMALFNLGNVMIETGNYASAIRYYQQSIAVNPDYAFAHNNLGIALQEWSRFDDALAHYHKAIQLKPDMQEAVRNTALLYEKQGKDAEAKHYYQQLIRLNPASKALRLQLNVLAEINFPDQAGIDNYRTKLQNVLTEFNPEDFEHPGDLADYGVYPSSELIYQGKDDKEVKESFARLFSNLPRVEVAHHNIKPHVGFVVTAGHEGVFIKCMRGILNNLDTGLFDITIVCSLPNGEKILNPVILNPDIKFISLPENISQALEILRKANIDILYYWEIGTDAYNYFLPLCKPAKIQCTSWGWPVTSGLKEVDYFISSAGLEAGGSQRFYTEKLVQFDRLPVLYYKPQVPEQRIDLSVFGLPDGVPVYFCQQNLRKVHPDFDEAIVKILNKDKKGIVVFVEDIHPAITAKLRNRLKSKAGIYSGRIYFVKRMPEDEYLSLLASTTVVLDTFHYGGGANTIYDAFAAGVPVITMPSEMLKGRYAFAAYQQIGIQDCIAADPDEFAGLAVRVANDAALRESIIARITGKQHEIFEDKMAVKELSDFLLTVFNSLRK